MRTVNFKQCFITSKMGLNSLPQSSPFWFNIAAGDASADMFCESVYSFGDIPGSFIDEPFPSFPNPIEIQAALHDRRRHVRLPRFISSRPGSLERCWSASVWESQCPPELQRRNQTRVLFIDIYQIAHLVSSTF
uniref:Uncharacterized protein n=1 Tax=Spongospora subterranea TaxID=70186 RepID=A0A0H5RCJ0_9EUKA|eukprot:CRZ11466.1 hypothetical protein [Spongospora subterranea]